MATSASTTATSPPSTASAALPPSRVAAVITVAAATAVAAPPLSRPVRGALVSGRLVISAPTGSRRLSLSTVLPAGAGWVRSGWPDTGRTPDTTRSSRYPPGRRHGQPLGGGWYVARDPIAELRRQLQNLFSELKVPQARLVKLAELHALPLRRTTLSDLLHGSGEPQWTTVEAFVLACELMRSRAKAPAVGPIREALLAPWQADYQQATGHSGPAIPRNDRVPAKAAILSWASWRQLNPVKALEVHPAITASRGESTGAPRGEMPALPAYVSRAHDKALTQTVDAVGLRSQFVVLVGGSSTGKTRACWEAVQRLPEEWQLWHPLAPTRARALLNGLRSLSGVLAPRTVLWLNELQDYLVPEGDPDLGEQAAAELRELLRDRSRGPVLALGTLWPEHWQRLTAVDGDNTPLHPHARELLVGNELRLPETFAGYEGQVAEAAERDPRWRAAMDYGRGRPTQYLAGGVFLLERYTNATAPEQALLNAAGDARRLGHPRVLPEAFLLQAAEDYLAEPDWVALPGTRRRDWAKHALTTLQPGRWGVPGPLRPVRGTPGAVELADFVEQHLRRTRARLAPPASLWTAAVGTGAEAETCNSLARSAEVRGRYRHAAELYQAAADAGDLGALIRLAELRKRAGDREEAERLVRAAADAGYPDALALVAHERERAGDRAEAIRLLRAAADAGHPDTLARFAEQRIWARDRAEAERLAWAAADAGRPRALVDLAELRERAGDPEGAERLARAAADAGHPRALVGLAELRERAGDREEAERLVRAAADAGHRRALASLALWRARAGNREEAERLVRAAAEAGDPGALAHLAELRERAGDREEAQRLVRAAAEAGDPGALADLARQREWAGDREEAERLARAAAEAGHPEALVHLAWWRERAGDRAEVERLFRAAADAGHPDALVSLVYERELDGHREKAEQLARAAADAGHPQALVSLAYEREWAGDRAEAQRLARAAADAGDPDGLTALAELRERAGDLKGANRLRRVGLTADGQEA
ncbi:MULTISPECIES: hypothetical protein [unclassified Modestobacter]|uniref:hypothetical protein n=1 Tax=unclassified Modestobacter TaxID=2643866 RepID=UPI0022AB0FA0|nr:MULTISPECIES: hypothetical protein [unclassified Modestobacter]MCZ2825997.1 hypothetical protein [Modestobacter sp. VKM Ac-2981]MCZ2852938.1 hypothetical protein [Modestobacter sp. VKM Ac-2982]